jgi:hypothetical protein
MEEGVLHKAVNKTKLLIEYTGRMILNVGMVPREICAKLTTPSSVEISII